LNGELKLLFNTQKSDMKFFYLLMILLLASCSTNTDYESLEKKEGKFYKINSEKPYSGKVNVYDSNKNIKETFNLLDGKKDGNYFKYFNNGNIQIKGSFNLGKKEGIEHEFNNANIVIRESEFVRGNLRNEKNYYQNGAKKSEKYFRGGTVKEYFYEKDCSDHLIYKEYYRGKLVEVHEKTCPADMRAFGGGFMSNETRTYYDKNEKIEKSCGYKNGFRNICTTYCDDGRENRATLYFENGYQNYIHKNKC
jgi:antitoxin component YwqK of YwqJK toxin-antitoxin module